MSFKESKKRSVNDDSSEGDWVKEGVSTGGMRWWLPDHDNIKHFLICVVESRGEKTTRYGARGYYVVLCQEDCVDSTGPITAGTQLIIWESAGLRDLANYVGKTVKIESNGRQGRMRTYSFFVRASDSKRKSA